MTAPPVTFAIPCYNQAAYVAEALQSALAQTYSPLEILVYDDASDDDSFAIVEDIAGRYGGPHPLRLHRSTENCGVEGYNTIVEKAAAEFIVIGHADDVFLPERTERQVAAWQATGKPLISSDAILIDETGREGGLLVRADDKCDPTLESICGRGWRSHATGATFAFSKALFRRFGGLSRDFTAVSTDWILPFRACLLGGAAYIDAPLIRYRQHDASRSSRFMTRKADPLADAERQLANSTIQFRYLIATLKRFRETGGTLPDLDRCETLLLATFREAAWRWADVRNRMMTERRVPGWHRV